MTAGDRIERARQLRRNSTFPERLLWSRLRRQQLGAKFRRQQPIGPYIADFFCPSHFLIIEVIGRSHDGTGDKDRARTRWLESEGYAVLKIQNDEIIEDVDHAVGRVLDALKAYPMSGAPSPCPLPRGERGEDQRPSA